MPKHERNAARSAKPSATRGQRHRWAHDATCGVPHQPEEKETHRRMFWLAEDDCTVTQGAASRNVEGGLDLYVRVCCLQPGAHAKPDGCRVSRAVSPGHGVSAWRCKGQLGPIRARKPARNELTTKKRSSWKRKFARSTHFFSSLLDSCGFLDQGHQKDRVSLKVQKAEPR